eukprot:CAMPEP_0115301612 /NCGR_PEP_ID=MMETSP0270-20121206/69950_1 /TAXON_ID=71861 /ORGANISM="Scrippsiella trochoidea, Strain CCMP3099" /LENGTH=196 /DNA_ID=CAMNT_0002719499 /DNA_START=788 /DNA_END=1377 /DNA_ORIENTATION=+
MMWCSESHGGRSTSPAPGGLLSVSMLSLSASSSPAIASAPSGRPSSPMSFLSFFSGGSLREAAAKAVEAPLIFSASARACWSDSQSKNKASTACPPGPKRCNLGPAAPSSAPEAVVDLGPPRFRGHARIRLLAREDAPAKVGELRGGLAQLALFQGRVFGDVCERFADEGRLPCTPRIRRRLRHPLVFLAPGAPGA